MQVALTPSSAAEVRLLAAFMQDLADLIEAQGSPAEVVAPFVPVPEGNVTAPAPKRTRGKKETSATTAETPVESGSSETAAPASAEAGNASAPAATEPAASSEAQAGSTTTDTAAGQDAAAAPEKVDIDTLRKLFGELTAAGKRDDAIAVVRAYKVNGLGELKDADRPDVFAKLKAL
jgi:hypothetical protein